MLSEQIIEFELRGPGPPGRTTPVTGYFLNKTKISEENLQVNYYLLLKYCRRQCAQLPLHGPNHLQLKFYIIMQDFKRVLNFNCK